MAPDLRRYVTLGVCVLVGIAGLSTAASAGAGTSYHLGLAIFLGAVIYGFIVVRRIIDAQINGESETAARFDASRLVPQSALGPWIALGVSTVVGILALSNAAHGRAGSLAYDLGIAIFLLAVAYAFIIVRVLVDRSNH